MVEVHVDDPFLPITGSTPPHGLNAPRRNPTRHRAHFYLGSLAVLLALATFSCRSAPPARKGRAGYVERGIASWYGPGFQGRRTASGERYNMHNLTAAHRTLPFGSLVEVRNRDNGRTVRVRINDRGPFIDGRIIDLSHAAARAIGMVGPGTARVEIRVMGSHRKTGSRAPTGEGYIVQAGAFRDSEKAKRLASELKRAFPEVRVRSGDGWHRVQLGPYDTLGKAEEILRSLERRGFSALIRAG